MPTFVPLVTCEHGGNELPSPYQVHFRRAQDLLDSHRGYDPGALGLARRLARTLSAPLFFSTTSRLLVDLNRSLGHRSIHAELLRSLSKQDKDEIIRRYYQPYRDQVEQRVRQARQQGERVCHLSIHSFTPSLHGEVRRADVAVLYDPRRPREKQLANQWLTAIDTHFPGLQLRRNYPYRGTADGFTTHLRRRFPATDYVGLELEVNQRFPVAGGTTWTQLQSAIVRGALSLFAP
jgi:predicted N-formylglutamate amidohydrolase